MTQTRDLTAIQQGMFGCTTRLIDADVASARKDSLSREPVKAMVLGLLSDAQELIAMGRQERAERLINRVKYIVDEHLSEEAQ